jgi:hypothetical protein
VKELARVLKGGEMSAIEHEVIAAAGDTDAMSGGVPHQRVQSGGRVDVVKAVARNRHADV